MWLRYRLVYSRSSIVRLVELHLNWNWQQVSQVETIEGQIYIASTVYMTLNCNTSETIVVIWNLLTGASICVEWCLSWYLVKLLYWKIDIISKIICFKFYSNRTLLSFINRIQYLFSANKLKQYWIRVNK